MHSKVCDGLCIDSAGADGLTSEVSQSVSMDGRNGIQGQVVLYAFTATTLSIQLQVSNDGVNWTNKGSAQTMSGIGRSLLTVDSSVAAAFARLQFTISAGSGKAILDAYIATSAQ